MKTKNKKPEYIPIRAVTGDDRNLDMLVEEVFHLQEECRNICIEYNINTKRLLLQAISDLKNNGIEFTEEHRENISNREFNYEQKKVFEFFANKKSLIDAINQERKTLQFMGLKISKDNQKKASAGRPIKNESDDTLNDVIASLARAHLNEKPSEIWPHLKTAISEWASTEVNETGDKGKDSRKYQFKVDEKMDTISFGVFRKKLRQ
ncbi:vacuolar-type H+-ATPase subunit I/STV1 [Oxalobacteraceae bacterium GrIS 1.11]